MKTRAHKLLRGLTGGDEIEVAPQEPPSRRDFASDAEFLRACRDYQEAFAKALVDQEE